MSVIDKILGSIPDPRQFDNTLKSAIECCFVTKDGYYIPDNVMLWFRNEATSTERQILLDKLHSAQMKGRKYNA